MEMTIQLQKYQFQIQKERTWLSQLSRVFTLPVINRAVLSRKLTKFKTSSLLILELLQRKKSMFKDKA